MQDTNIQANSVEYDATKNAVTAVTVFQSDRAEIRRTIKVELKDGQNDVEVKNLPTCLDESSIRVDGIGDAVIFDVIYHPPTSTEKKKDVAEDLLAQKEELHEKLAILNRQSAILQEYSKTLSGKDTSSDQLESFLDIFSTRQSALDDKKRALNNEIKALEKEIQEAHVKVNADVESIQKRGVRITVIVLAQGDGTAELSLTYVVSHASWTPHYDLRAFIASNPGDATKPGKATETAEATSSVELHYRASIAQHTGEDWSSVELTLSTASPLQGTSIPKLDPVWISERTYGYGSSYSNVLVPPQAPRLALPAPQMKRKSNLMIDKCMSGSDDLLEQLAEPAPYMAQIQATINHSAGGRGGGGMRAPISDASEGAVSTTFTIPGLSAIPSGSDDSQQTHKVSISELQFDSVDFEWITVPKKITSVYLKCKVRNTSKFVLLSGEANVFMNNNFVAKSRIPHVSPLEHFSCSLGVDPALRITYHPSSKKTRVTGGTLLTGAKTTVTNFEQRTTVRNTRAARVHRVRIREQIPVSRDARFKVVVLEPRALVHGVGGTVSASFVGLSNASAGYLVGEGIRVRWVPLQEWSVDDMTSDGTSVFSGTTKASGSDAPSAESAQGLLEWICDLDAGASVDVALIYEVSGPAGVNWSQSSA